MQRRSESLESTVDATNLLQLSRTIGISDESFLNIFEMQTNIINDPKRLRAITRTILELYKPKKRNEAEINMLILRPVEPLLIRGLMARAAGQPARNISGSREFQQPNLPEDRKGLLEFLDDPAYLSVLGSAALNSYFLYRPVTRAEAGGHKVASLYFREKQNDGGSKRPMLNRSHFEWLAGMVDGGVALNNEWLRRMNLLAQLGSGPPIEGESLVREAKSFFFKELGLLESSADTDSLPPPLTAIAHMRLLHNYDVNGIGAVLRELPTLLHNKPNVTEEKLQELAATNFDFSNPANHNLLCATLQSVATPEESTAQTSTSQETDKITPVSDIFAPAFGREELTPEPIPGSDIQTPETNNANKLEPDATATREGVTLDNTRSGRVDDKPQPELNIPMPERNVDEKSVSETKKPQASPEVVRGLAAKRNIIARLIVDSIGEGSIRGMEGEIGHLSLEQLEQLEEAIYEFSGNTMRFRNIQAMLRRIRE